MTTVGGGPKEVFSAMELRLIRYSVSKVLKEYEERLKTVDPESDKSIELGNDSVLLSNILEKISDREDV